VIQHTKAFATFRTLSQAHINFVVLVCHAVPALRADLALPTASLSNLPDHFNASRNPKAEVATYVIAYQEELARSTLITVFSYFESYIKDALGEIVEFHGGKDEFKKLAMRRTSKFINSARPDIKLNKRKLQDNPVPSKLAKYQKYGKLLEDRGFKFPTELFAHFGVSQLLPKLDEKRGMQAWEIPSLLEECLLFPISTTERDHFETIRSLRNKIGHGRGPTVVLQKSLHYASILHTLAAKVDRHITEHFLVIQAV
jgi:hypothetical protein